jgi:FAD/FMN-containing dehydrogenase
MVTLSSPLAALAPQITGPVLEPGSPGFVDEVAAFNLSVTPSPAVVVGATGPDDVAAAARYAAETDRRLAVQSTGHGLVDPLHGTVLVTTRRLTEVVVDPATATARIGAGVRWRQVIDAAAPHGLAPLSGASSLVGAVGYTVGGGLGPMARRFGFAADHVRRFTIVTADGTVREVDADREPDLFWAVRGAKGNFGIVTELEVDLVPVTRFYGGGLFFPGPAAPAVLHAWREWAPTVPEDTTTAVALLRLPPDPALPEPLRGQFVTHLRFAHLGSADEGAALLAPMRTVAEPVLDLIDERPYTAVDVVNMDPVTPLPHADAGTALSALPAEAVDVLLAHAGPGTDTPLVLVEVRLLGGAIARAPRVPNAVTVRDAPFSLYALAVPDGPSAPAAEAAAPALVDALAPWAHRALINWLGPAGPERVQALWTDADRARLLAIKDRYDPTGMLSTNIPLT